MSTTPPIIRLDTSWSLKPRKVVRDIPCDTCGRTFGQTGFEFSRKLSVCPQCKKTHIQARNPNKPIKKRGPRNPLEVVLPQTLKAVLDPHKQEWYMKVRVRKKGTTEDLKYDKVFLGLGADAPPEQVERVFKSAYARMELNGASKYPAEMVKKKRKRIRTIRNDLRSWRQGLDRDLGVLKLTIKKVIYKVHLPDPKVDGVKHYVGRFDTRKEAREARNAKYRELRKEIVPCAVCGMMPNPRAGQITHFSATCPNRVQLPQGVRALFQVKLWNLVFSEGKVPDAGKLTHEDLYYMGFMKKSPKGFRYYGRTEVEFNFSLAKNFVKKREEDPEFE